MTASVVIWRRGLTLALAVLGAAAAMAPPAGAHALLVGSEPADGATLERAPGEVRLRFDEEVSSRFRRVSLLDQRGRAVAASRVSAGRDGREIVVRAAGLRRGTYAVSWDVLAKADGHVTGGEIVFGVGTAPVAAAGDRTARDARPPALSVALRWADFALLAAVLGGLAISLLILRALSHGTVPIGVAAGAGRRVLVSAACGAGLAVALGVVLLVREAHGLLATLAPGTSYADVLGRLVAERYGLLWLLREALLIALAGCAILLLRDLRGRRTRVRATFATAIACALALCACRAMGAHAAAVHASGAGVAFDAVHLFAAAVWIGGVLAFAVALWPAGSGSASLARACRRPLAWSAGTGLAVLAATGLYAARAQITSVDGLLTTFYGHTLLVKTAVVLAIALLGLANGVLLRSPASGLRGHGGASLRRIGPRRLLLAEGLVGLLALLAAAALTASSPPRGPEFAAPQAVRAPTLVRQVGDVLLTATARPNRPGTNLLTVMAVSSRRPAPAPIDGVKVRIAGARDGSSARRDVTLHETSPGRYSGGARLSHDGRWRMTVVATRGGERIAAGFDWSVRPADPARPVVYSARPLAPLIDRAALVLALLLVTGALLLAAAVVPRRIGPAGPISTIEALPEEAR
jgi:copper transport protein